MCTAIITCLTWACPQICNSDNIIEIPPQACLLSAAHLLNAVPFYHEWYFMTLGKVRVITSQNKEGRKRGNITWGPFVRERDEYR